MTIDKQPSTHSNITRAIDTAAAVIFDNDGTLVDSMPIHFTAWKQALNMHRIQLSETQFYKLAGLPARAIIDLLKEQQNVIDITFEQVMTARHKILKHLLSTVKPIQISVKLLEYAHANNIPLALASGGERNDVLASLQSAAINVSLFGAIVTADDVANGKPHPETFLKAAAKLGVDPTKCIGFEDGEKGLDALRAAGMFAIDIRRIEGYPLPQCLR